jgi:hypothetical protein
MAKRAQDRLAEILTELAHIGPVLPGSITDRRTRCQRSGCHCRAEPAVLHGPYRTWTWRPSGVPVTKTLTEEESERLAPYSVAHHRLRQLVSELEQVSLELIEQSEGIDFGRAREVGNRRLKLGSDLERREVDPGQ